MKICFWNSETGAQDERDATPEEVAEVVARVAAAAIPVVPQSVTRRQAKQALLLQGLLANVQPAIDAILDTTQRGLMQIEWDDSQEFVRTRTSLIQIGTALGLDAAGLDALFVQAGGL